MRDPASAARLSHRTAFTDTSLLFFFFNDTATTEIYTLSLHDALPIYTSELQSQAEDGIRDLIVTGVQTCDRKSTRLNSSHDQISYAVFCLRSEEHTSELQSRSDLVCRLLLEKKKTNDRCTAAPAPTAT